MSFLPKLRSSLAGAFDLSLSLRTFLVVCLTVSIFVFMSSYVVFGGSFQFDISTLLLSVALMLVLLVGLIKMPESGFPLTLLLGFHLSVFCIPRLYGYLMVPDSISLPYPIGLLIAEINTTVLFITIGTAVMLAGIFLGDLLWQKRLKYWLPAPKDEESFAYALPAYLFVFLAILIFGILTLIHLDLRVGGAGPRRFHTLIMAVRTLIGSDAAFFFGFCSFFLIAFKRPKAYYYLFVLVFMYSAYLTFIGSKGATFRISQILLIIHVVRFGSQSIKIWKLAGIALLLTSVGPLLFSIGNNIKLMHVLKTNSYALAKAHSNPQPKESRNRQIYTEFVNQHRPEANAARLYFEKHIEPKFESKMIILNRLGELDYTIFALTKVLDEKERTRIFSLNYLWRSIANILLPGDPFKDADLRTERYPPLLYSSWAIGSVREYFNTEPFTAWGISYLYFGKLGGLIFLFIVSLLMNVIFQALRQSFPFGRYQYSSLFAWGGFTCFLGSFGLDNNLTTLMFLFVQMFIVQYAISCVSKLLNRFSGSVDV